MLNQEITIGIISERHAFSDCAVHTVDEVQVDLSQQIDQHVNVIHVTAEQNWGIAIRQCQYCIQCIALRTCGLPIHSGGRGELCENAPSAL